MKTLAIYSRKYSWNTFSKITRMEYVLLKTKKPPNKVAFVVSPETTSVYLCGTVWNSIQYVSSIYKNSVIVKNYIDVDGI